MNTLRQKLRRLLDKATFPGSADYWRRRYARGGNSGEGSYGQLARFKAEVLNDFVAQHHIQSVIEFGCGDGNQLTLARYPSYLGFDVSCEAVAACRRRFAGDVTKRFLPAEQYHGETADLALSLDVIYHLVEDAVFDAYMARLFDASLQYVIIYSSNCRSTGETAPHVRHRVFTEWIAAHRPQARQLQVIPNRYPIGLRPQETSFAHFFIYQE